MFVFDFRDDGDQKLQGNVANDARLLRRAGRTEKDLYDTDSK